MIEVTRGAGDHNAARAVHVAVEIHGSRASLVERAGARDVAIERGCSSVADIENIAGTRGDAVDDGRANCRVAAAAEVEGDGVIGARGQSKRDIRQGERRAACQAAVEGKATTIRGASESATQLHTVGPTDGCSATGHRGQAPVVRDGVGSGERGRGLQGGAGSGGQAGKSQLPRAEGGLVPGYERGRGAYGGRSAVAVAGGERGRAAAAGGEPSSHARSIIIGDSAAYQRTAISTKRHGQSRGVRV